jgi:DNA-binding response OmpR family regulator
MPTIDVLVSDLMFQPRIVDAARALGYEVRVVGVAEQRDGASLVVVDLHEPSMDAAGVIRAARSRGARVLAFGRHTDVEALRAARDAGADEVVPRSQLVGELPDLLRALAAEP